MAHSQDHMVWDGQRQPNECDLFTLICPRKIRVLEPVSCELTSEGRSQGQVNLMTASDILL